MNNDSIDKMIGWCFAGYDLPEITVFSWTCSSAKSSYVAKSRCSAFFFPHIFCIVQLAGSKDHNVLVDQTFSVELFYS